MLSGHRLRAARERAGLSREYVARELDPPISTKTLERWEKETNARPIPRPRGKQFAELYGCRIRDLEHEPVAA